MAGELIFEIVAGPQLQSGSFPSIHSYAAPFWADSQNVSFVDGGVEKQLGRTLRVDFSNAPDSLQPVQHIAQARLIDGTNRIWVAGPNSLGYYDSTIEEDPAINTPTDTNWSLAAWDDWLIACNDTDQPRIWKPSAASVELENATSFPAPKAKIARKHNKHLLLLNTDVNPRAVHWSAFNDPAEFEILTTNEAGSIFMRNFSSEIIAGETLGTGFAVYGRNQMQVLTYSGAPFYYLEGRVVNGIGAASKNAIIPVSGIHYGLGRSGIFRTDGISYAYVDRPAVHDYIQSNVDFSDETSIVSYHSSAQEEVSWFFLRTDGNPGGIKYNYRNNTWTPLSPATKYHAAEEAILFDNPLASLGEGAEFGVYNQNVGYNCGYSSLPIEAWVQSKELDFGAPQKAKYISTIIFICDYIGNVSVTLGKKETVDPNESIVWLDTQTNPVEYHPNQEAKFWILKIEANTLDSWFKFAGMKVFGTGAGDKEM